MDTQEYEDEEYEEEEVLMCVSLPVFENLAVLDDPETEIEIIGLEGEHPEIRINNVVFQGHHEVNIGSMMIFSDQLSGDTTSTLEKKNVDLVGTSINCIKCDMKQVIPPANAAQSDDANMASVPMDM